MEGIKSGNQVLKSLHEVRFAKPLPSLRRRRHGTPATLCGVLPGARAGVLAR